MIIVLTLPLLIQLQVEGTVVGAQPGDISKKKKN